MKYFKIWTTASLFIIAFVSFSFSSFGCHDYSSLEGGDLDKIIEKQFDTSPGKSFVLKAAGGDVIIRTSDEPKVAINIYGNERAKQRLNFDFDNNEDGVTVEVKSKDNWNLFNLFRNVRLKFEITLPKNYNAEINTSGGDISLSDLKGKIKLNSSGGDISVANTNGNVAVKTSGGDIKLENSNGDIHLTTSGGDVKAFSFNGNIDASTSGGNIELNGENGKINATTSGGEVSLNYSGSNNGIYLSSSGGNISLKLPSDFNADAHFSTSGGSIKCSFKANEVSNFSSSKLEGKFNNGGNDLTAKTSGGDIYVEQK